VHVEGARRLVDPSLVVEPLAQRRLELRAAPARACMS